MTLSELRGIKKIWKNHVTMEGAGVRLKRVFGYNEVPQLDPFLLLDHFGSDNPDDYIRGFPWHPHRGIETITYMLNGDVEHGDSLGNGGVIGSGDVQWMTAGSGIIHQEMPHRIDGLMQGFQLWANLPASHKMMDPRYRDVRSEEIPTVAPTEGVSAKIICGEIAGTKGPVQDIITEPQYYDIKMEPNALFNHDVKSDHNVFVYVFQGEGLFHPDSSQSVETDNLVHYGDGEEISISSKDSGVRFLLISGKPIGEPVAWYGPIVMNTQEELDLAFREYREETFIKHK